MQNRVTLTAEDLPTLTYDGQKWGGNAPAAVLIYLDACVTQHQVAHTSLAEQALATLRAAGMHDYSAVSDPEEEAPGEDA